jgi:hypothetical protein
MPKVKALFFEKAQSAGGLPAFGGWMSISVYWTKKIGGYSRLKVA